MAFPSASETWKDFIDDPESIFKVPNWKNAGLDADWGEYFLADAFKHQEICSTWKRNGGFTHSTGVCTNFVDVTLLSPQKQRIAVAR